MMEGRKCSCSTLAHAIWVTTQEAVSRQVQRCRLAIRGRQDGGAKGGIHGRYAESQSVGVDH